MSTEWRDELIEAYRRYRIDDQARYYERRAAQYEQARRWSVTITAGLLVLASLFGALGAADAQRRAVWAFIAAALAAMGTAITTFESAFGFERFSRQYGETRASLALADVHGPRSGAADAPDGDVAVLEFVSSVERILRSEVESWSEQARQPVRGDGTGEPPAP